MPSKQKKDIPTTQKPQVVATTQETDLLILLWKWAPLAILLLTAFLYYNAAFSAFTTFDDDAFILKNKLVQDGSVDGILKIFTTFSAGKYQPLTSLVFALQHNLFGFDPLIFHVTNITLHLVNTFIIFKIAERLSGNRVTAIITALLFGIHPMHVEEVAWASELKDLLYAFFYLFALLVYLAYIETGYSIKKYLGVILLFTCSLLSKESAATLPFILLLIDVYKGRKLTGRGLLEKLPLLTLSVIVYAVSYLSMQADGAVGQLSAAAYGTMNRLFLFTSVPAFYIIKVVAPFSLSAMHYYPDLHNGSLPLVYYLSLPFFILITWLVARRNSFRKEMMFGVFFFLITICVMPQIVSVGPALTPERYSYIPYLGFFYVIGQWISKIGIARWKDATIITFSCFAFMYCALTWYRVGVWKDDDTLFSDVLKKNTDVADCSYFFWLKGNSEVAHNDIRTAVKDYSQAINEHHGYAEAFANRGVANFQLGFINKAVSDYTEAIKDAPANAMNYYNRAAAEATGNNFKGALGDYNSFLKIDSTNSAAYTSRGMVRLNLDDTSGACSDWQRASQMGDQAAGQFIQHICQKQGASVQNP